MRAADPGPDANGLQPPGHEELAFGRMPLLPGEREYGTRGAHTTCFAYAIATWCFLTGGYVAQLVGAVEGVICLIRLMLLSLQSSVA